MTKPARQIELHMAEPLAILAPQFEGGRNTVVDPYRAPDASETHHSEPDWGTPNPPGHFQPGGDSAEGSLAWSPGDGAGLPVSRAQLNASEQRVCELMGISQADFALTRKLSETEGT